MKIKAGTTIIFTQGEYSNFRNTALMTALLDFDTEQLKLRKFNGGFKYGNIYEVIIYLEQSGLCREVDQVELHLEGQADGTVLIS